MKDKTILLVDDEEENVTLLRQALAQDYHLVVAKNGPQAIKMAQENPDLILLDIMMPGMDGYEVCRRLKAATQTRDIPVIFVTAEQEIANQHDGFQLGAVDYIAKPITPLLVEARVKMHLERRRATDRRATHEFPPPLFATRHDPTPSIQGMMQVLDAMLVVDPPLATDHQLALHTVRHHGFHALCAIRLAHWLPQMEDGTFESPSGTCDLMSVIHIIQGRLTSTLRAKEVTIKTHIQAQTANPTFLVRGDQTLCYALLDDLIKNAVEASPEGRTVAIAMRVAGEMAVVRIRNAGTVPQKMRDRFFDKHATTKKHPGTGLGTYSAKLITTALGGKIRMRTDDTKGTEVSFLIPKAVSTRFSTAKEVRNHPHDY